MSNIGERIRTIREERNMSQIELAEAVGYKTASAINKIEMGLRNINQSKIETFAKALSVEPSQLMGWDITASDEQFIIALFGTINKKTISLWEEVREFAEYLNFKYNNP